jgi:CheY-like chemotaxis protein
MSDPPVRVDRVKRTREFATGDEERARVLVVDDDWEICDAVKDSLEGEGFEVACVSNGQHALDHLRSHPAPHAILLDLFMPVMDGWALAKQLRASPSYSAIPVVVMTASGPHWGYPVSRVIRKPVMHHELISIVRRAIDSGSADGNGGGAARSSF